MSWYRIGTVSVTNGSKVVTGSGTAWAANVQAGDAFHAPDGKTYEIDFVGADASMNLVDNYAGTTASGQSYKVQPTQGRVRDLAAAVSTLITEYGSIENALTVLSGNVGIGRTPSGAAALDVQSDAAGIVRVRGGAGANQGAGFFATSGSDTTRFAAGQYSRIFGGTPNNDGAVYAAGVLSLASGGVVAATLDTSGNVGIGTSSPLTRLDVRSAGSYPLRVQGTTATSAGGLQIFNDSGTNGVTAFTYGSAYSGGTLLNAGAGAGVVVASGSAPLAIATDAGNTSPLILGVNNAEALRIINGGNVGIGTSSPSAKLDVTANDVTLALRDPRDGAAAPTAATKISFYRHFGVNEVGRISAVGTSASGNPLNEAALVFSIANGTGLAERLRIDAPGNMIPVLTDAPPTLTTARQMVFTRVSDTQVRLSMRGADGTTRSTTLTLA